MHKNILLSCKYHGGLGYPQELNEKAVAWFQNCFGTQQSKDFKVISLIIKLITLKVVELYLFELMVKGFSILHKLFSVCQVVKLSNINIHAIRKAFTAYNV